MSSNLKPASTMPGTRLANHLAGRDAAISSTPTGDFPDPFFPGIEKYKDEPGASEPLSIDGDDPEPQQPPTDKTTRAFRKALIQLVGFTAIIVVLTLVFMARVGGPAGKEDGDQQPITSSASEATTLHTSQLENESYALRLPELPVITPAPTLAPTEAAPEATNTMVEPASTVAEENEKKKPHKKGCIFSADHDSARFENEHHNKHNKLYAGQFICSQNHQNEGEEHHRYQFGVSNRGDLVLKDRMIAEQQKKHLRTTTNNNEYDRILYHHSNKDGDHTTTDEVGDDYHLSLTTDGTLMISASVNEHLWSLPPKNQELHLTEHCLDHHDCPYLHMHPDGVLVVNYIDDAKEWQHKNFFKVYDV